MVGSFITPYLQPDHDIRVLDMTEPTQLGVEFVKGSVMEPTDLQKALKGVDSFVWLVMRSPQGGSVTDQNEKIIRENYEVNCLGLHMFLYTAQMLGVRSGVYTSSMSVHYRNRAYFPAEEGVPFDTPSAYGLSKGFGEGICRYFAHWFDMNIAALRITGPRPRDRWVEERRNPVSDRPDGSQPLFVTDEEDLASAYAAALGLVQEGYGRFDAFFIAGDEHQKEHNLTKAKRVLGWEPKTHLKIEE